LDTTEDKFVLIHFDSAASHFQCVTKLENLHAYPEELAEDILSDIVENSLLRMDFCTKFEEVADNELQKEVELFLSKINAYMTLPDLITRCLLTELPFESEVLQALSVLSKASLELDFEMCTSLLYRLKKKIIEDVVHVFNGFLARKIQVTGEKLRENCLLKVKLEKESEEIKAELTLMEMERQTTSSSYNKLAASYKDLERDKTDKQQRLEELKKQRVSRDAAADKAAKDTKS